MALVLSPSKWCLVLALGFVAIACGNSNGGSGPPESEAGVDATTPDASGGGGDATSPMNDSAVDAADSGTAGDATAPPVDAGGDSSDASSAIDASDAADTGADAADAGTVVYVSGATVSTLAGSDEAGAGNGTGVGAQFDNPTGIAIDSAGDLIVTDYDGSDVRMVTPLGVVTTLADATGFTGPFSAAVASDGAFFVGTDFDSTGAKDSTSGTIWRVVPLSDGGVAAPIVVAQGFGRPRGLAPVANGNLVFSDRLYSTIQFLAVDGGVATFLAGSGDAGFADGTGAGAIFNMPLGAATLPGGDVLVADPDNNRIRRVTSGGVVTTFAGDGVAAWTDGPLAGAELNLPRAVAIDAAGNVYVSDTGNHCIRRILATGAVDTLAGNGVQGFQDGAGYQAELYGQEGIAVTPDGKIVYFTDGNSGDGTAHHRVREITVP